MLIFKFLSSRLIRIMSSEAEASALFAEIQCQPVSEKNFVGDEFRTSVFRRLRARTENRTCFDCPARNPTWISLSNGVYVCLVCSGEHRRMGVHVSFVRSLELDSFTQDQLTMMVLGGNGKARSFFKSVGIDGKRKDAEQGSRVVDYFEKTAARWRSQLEKETVASCQKHEIPLVNIGKGKRSPKTQARDVVPAPKPGFNQASGTWDGPVAPLTEEKRVQDARTSDSLAAELFGNFDVGTTASQATTMYQNESSPPPSGSSMPSAFESPFSLSEMKHEGPAHFASSGGVKQAVGGKAKQLVDDDLDFDFADFEKELTRVVNVPPPQPMISSNSGGFRSNSSSTGPVIEESYGMPVTRPSPQDLGFNPSTTESGTNLADFSNKKSFGSADLFKSDQNNSSSSATANPNFQGQKAFGSAAFFSNDPNVDLNRGPPSRNSPPIDWEGKRDQARETGKFVAEVMMEKATDFSDKAWVKMNAWKDSWG